MTALQWILVGLAVLGVLAILAFASLSHWRGH